MPRCPAVGGPLHGLGAVSAGLTVPAAAAAAGPASAAAGDGGHCGKRRRAVNGTEHARHSTALPSAPVDSTRRIGSAVQRARRRRCACRCALGAASNASMCLFCASAALCSCNPLLLLPIPCSSLCPSQWRGPPLLPAAQLRSQFPAPNLWHRYSPIHISCHFTTDVASHCNVPARI